MKVFVKNKLIFQSVNAFALIAILLNVFAPVVYANNLKQQLHYQKLLRSITSQDIEFTQKEVFDVVQESKTNNNLVADNSTSKSVTTQFKNVSSVAGGPGQSETSGFSISSTDGLVDKFTGDFSYSIPLADVEGYPLVLTYNSNVNMNTEASWVGLGWDLNVGAVNRSMRGLPDEFNGEQVIKKTFNQAEDHTDGTKNGGYLAYQLNVSKNKKFGSIGIQATTLWGKYNNTYLGLGKTFDFGLQASVSAGYEKSGLFIAPSFGYGYSSDTKRGIGTSTTYGLSSGLNKGIDGGLNGSIGYSIGTSFNSRQGLESKVQSINASVGYHNEKNGNLGFSASYGASSILPYGSITSIPSVRLNSYGKTTSLGFDVFGGVTFGMNTIKTGFLNTTYNTNISIAKNSDNQILQPALGYFHNGKYDNYAVAPNSKGSTTPLMDFNRVNDTEYSEEMANLAFSFQTYDVFTVSALGVGATFRGHRSDVGTYEDAASKMSNTNEGNEIKTGAVFSTNPFSIGFTLANGNTSGSAQINSGEFGVIDVENNKLSFNSESTGSKFDKAVYFKAVGEMTPVDTTDLKLLGGKQWTYPSFKLVNQKEVKLSGDLKHKSTNPTVISSSAVNASNERIIANYFRPYTSLEYSQLEGENEFKVFNGSSYDFIPRLQTQHPNEPYYSNHLSAIETVATDGTRYIFGIPAYELKTSQVSFCVTGKQDNNGDGIINYDNGDNTVDNSKGLSNFFEKTDVPAYPHSFLLTEMLSSDYIDRTNNGPSLDDVGNFYSFQYTRLFDQTNPYKWRFPVGENSAMFNKGMLGTELDDLANYTYGEKEIWYAKQVESKNLVAEFELEDREDAQCVLENGNLDPNPNSKLKRLKFIKIYNRSERTGSNGANAIPLQIIEFIYTYELCKDYPTNSNSNFESSGKLTLDRILSYSGNSEELSRYYYDFNYGTGNENPDFSYVTDAWGMKKDIDLQKPNDIFPYTKQDLNSANINANAWKLKEIITPTNGKIEVNYESDTYVSVQDSKSMTHIDLKGMMSIARLDHILQNQSWNLTQDLTSDFLETNTSGLNNQNVQFMEDYLNLTANFDGFPVANVMVFKLPTSISTANSFAVAQELMQQNYFKDSYKSNSLLSEVFFKTHVKIKGNVSEMIPLFARVDQSYGNIQSIGLLPPSTNNGDYDFGYVILKPAIMNDDDGKKKGYVYHPIQKAALEFARRNLPDVVYGATASASADQKLILDKSIKKTDINHLMINKNWCPGLILDFSTIRVYSLVKYGGNGRVSKITYRDNWTEMSGENSPGVYSWKYTYSNGRGEYAGNAAFEPIQIIDECALYQWNTYVNKKKKFPDETKFTPTPIAAPLYPDPIIGYEKVRVSIDGVENRGFSETMYITSYDKPVIFEKSHLDKTIETDKPSNIITGKTTDRFAYSQGFYIETNDFHGKIKQISIYANDIPIQGQVSQAVLQSQTTYKYQDLENKIPMVKNNGEVKKVFIAQEYDIHADTRFVLNEVKFTDLTVGIDVKYTPPTLIYAMPIFSFSTTSRTEAFYSSSLVKHLNRSAILSKIETRTFNSTNTAENILYDFQSGNVIMSSLNDEYNDKLYSLEYPSHWYFKELRDIASSQNRKVSITIGAGGIISNMDNVLTPGDKIVIDQNSCPNCNYPVYVAKKNTTTNGDLFLMKVDGNNSFGNNGYPNSIGTYDVEIVRSNRDNRLNETMENFVTKKELYDSNSVTLTFPTNETSEIISSSVITYRDRNNLKCGRPSDKDAFYSNNEVTVNQFLNPYLYGVRGDLVIDQQYNWQSERVQSSNPFKTRFDGAYAIFTPFYSLNQGNWTQYNFSSEPPVNITGWRPNGIVSTFDVFGKPIESKNELKMFSSVLYSYNTMFDLLPIANAMNARQQEIVFEGFEDNLYYANYTTVKDNLPHFGLNTIANNNVVYDVSSRHSGNQSLKILNLATISANTYVENSICIAKDAIDETSNSFKVRDCHCIDPFKPTLGKYIIGAWVKNDNPLSPANGTITVNIEGATTSNYVFSASGPVIDGWQRLEGTFTIDNPSNLTNQLITISLNHISGSSVNFDDIRIHPEMSSMTTTVYDSKSLLPIATHDSNNFTTFYNYDDNNNLVRVRVETIEGIKTVSENEMGGFKKID